jgi:hypothetical protein
VELHALSLDPWDNPIETSLAAKNKAPDEGAVSVAAFLIFIGLIKI